jgi:hypothetical protein
MPVITKKDEKIEKTASSLQKGFAFEGFIKKFKELYPKDWAKIEKIYRDHVRDTKPGKKIPMPKPDQYLKNALNVWTKKNQKNRKNA